MDIILKLSEELGIKKSQAEAAVKLIDEGNTIPFIARYRKEVTGSLNDEVLRNLYERLTYLRNLEERKETVLNSIEEQGKLTDELKAQILAAETMVAVEEKIHRRGRNSRGRRGFIPPLQTKAQNKSYDCKGEGTRTPCQCDHSTDVKHTA